MTLGDVIKEYREAHHLSQGDFSKRSDLSRGYISMLENNKNPQSGKPISLTIETVQKAAIGMGIGFNDLIAMIDQSIDISDAHMTNEPATPTDGGLSPEQREVLRLFDAADPTHRQIALEVLKASEAADKAGDTPEAT